ncbi:NAD(P)/FAD-dependent oxidoreductase [Paraburkholderia hospita]|uniref:Benzene 1,2-dioxygenase n=1 Tax=Paraburkholderia hospita TaxID=169430 RepID=A0AAN1JH58_9BURK|nr:FAD-dependent oxidoreductase [Paraburkholderia hospita]AUT73635.1 benzene 1,2-dioxygenase [Paraburkholderia hospita]EIM99144.1 benzene 1,2-dioxygenase system ferredoxin--NAD(+) reductase subunit [Paraburkholderia hospita]OUL72824.1 benzene 1,2-dioxygenase [Paraburkholderia hospita]OUL97233.1 benzene 1,2-dioxygenase [Paraburkholderia hospita]SEH73309.1 3-phenylpropionate/trans-cinnamate dioxygenase ferredoxin reductase subunit [Paraburkholderia hospita]
MSSPHVAIVGAGHAGGRVAQHLKAFGHTGPVTLIGDEPHAPYERPALSKELLLGTKTQESIALSPAAYWTTESLLQAGIARIHASAQSLDVDARRLQLDNGVTVDFDLMVVATGGIARRPRFVRQPIEGVHALRTLDDCLTLRSSLQGCRKLAIIGAGVIGMEVASSAIALGVPVTVLEAGDGIMARCLPSQVAGWLAHEHVAKGVDLRTRVNVTDIARAGAIDGDTFALRIDATQDGVPLSIGADCVLIAIGVDCNPAFLHGSGLSDEHGVLVDAFCRSPSAPWLYAAGDAACTLDTGSSRHIRQETWRNAENQARAVAGIITGRTEPYSEIQWMWTDQLGHTIQVTGVHEPGDETVVRGSLASADATVISLRNGCVAAGVTINQSRERRHLERLVSGRRRVDAGRLGDTSVPLKELV